MFEKIQDSLEADVDGANSVHSQQRSERSPSNNGQGDDNSFDGNFDGNEVMMTSFMPNCSSLLAAPASFNHMEVEQSDGDEVIELDDTAFQERITEVRFRNLRDHRPPAARRPSI